MSRRPAQGSEDASLASPKDRRERQTMPSTIEFVRFRKCLLQFESRPHLMDDLDRQAGRRGRLLLRGQIVAMVRHRAGAGALVLEGAKEPGAGRLGVEIGVEQNAAFVEHSGNLVHPCKHAGRMTERETGYHDVERGADKG